ncbi:MAG: helix-turn-helix transcriptional regulator [Litoreibacter sp.]|uniref:helix-turn-helix domain-containing protein n=1 Tax=Litoreibacter sp. TaxID=1969459 RepID=UPI003299DD37
MAHEVDIHIGKRLRHRRWMVGMTQGELAGALGIRFQQIQKYESGSNRVSASRLWDIAQVLDLPVGYFFHGLDGGLEQGHEDASKANIEANTLIRFYRSMPDVERQRLRGVVSQSAVPDAVSP